jgi:hypothetical protein
VQRDQFEQLVVRAAALARRRDLVIFGSQSVHAVTRNPPAEVLVSVECDIWLRDEPAIAEKLVAELGKDSAFAQSTGVYVDPLPSDFPLAPTGWEDRLVAYPLGEITARCLEIHDLIVTKLAAGRLKDYEFIAAVLMGKLARPGEVQRRLQTFPDPHTQALLLARLRIATEATDVRL